MAPKLDTSLRKARSPSLHGVTITRPPREDEFPIDLKRGAVDDAPPIEIGDLIGRLTGDGIDRWNQWDLGITDGGGIDELISEWGDLGMSFDGDVRDRSDFAGFEGSPVDGMISSLGMVSISIRVSMPIAPATTTTPAEANMPPQSNEPGPGLRDYDVFQKDPWDSPFHKPPGAYKDLPGFDDPPPEKDERGWPIGPKAPGTKITPDPLREDYPNANPAIVQRLQRERPLRRPGISDPEWAGGRGRNAADARGRMSDQQLELAVGGGHTDPVPSDDGRVRGAERAGAVWYRRPTSDDPKLF